MQHEKDLLGKRGSYLPDGRMADYKSKSSCMNAATGSQRMEYWRHAVKTFFSFVIARRDFGRRARQPSSVIHGQPRLVQEAH